MNETPQQAARRLAARELASGYQPEALHAYQHPDGSPAFWVIRLKHPDGQKWMRPMMPTRDGYALGRPEAPEAGTLLYRLPDVLAATGTVWLVEGEKCADTLHKLGLTVTTTGSASSFKGADLAPLAGRHVTVWPDNDKAGRKYADEMSARLIALGCTVEWVDVEALELDEKDDCVDWLAAHPGATAADVEALARVAPPLPAPELHDEAPRLLLVRGDSIQPEAVDWLWPGWLAAGKLHLIGGQPGTGKTTIAASLAAVVSRGSRWPDGCPAEAGDVLFWSGEDDVKDTLAPRLRAAGADMARVHFIEGVQHQGERYPFDPARDMDVLRDALRHLPRVRLMVIDPIVSAVAGDSHKNAEVRRGLQPLVDLAGEMRCALLGVTHFSKGTSGRDPTERITGSLAFGALARVVMVTAKQEAQDDQPERRMLLRAKSNIGRDGGGFAYCLQQGALPDLPEVSASSVAWGEAIEGSAREVLAEAEGDHDDQGEQRDAVAWLREELASGEIAVKEMKRRADEAGFAWRTVQRAMRRAGVESKRGGFGKGAVWRLANSPISAAFAPFAPHSVSGAEGANGGKSGAYAAAGTPEDSEGGAQFCPPSSPPSAAMPPSSGSFTTMSEGVAMEVIDL